MSLQERLELPNVSHVHFFLDDQAQNFIARVLESASNVSTAKLNGCLKKAFEKIRYFDLNKVFRTDY